jgi:predicted negative regulator of RcsB-dependent stress response
MQYSDDEQVEKLKAWWKTYGNALVVGVLLGLGLLYGGKYYKRHTVEQSIQASMVFDQMIYAERQNDKAGLRRLGSELTEKYKSTPYAGLAALVMSRDSFNANDRTRAEAQLTWAMDNAKEEAVREAARLRLGRVLLDANKVDRVLELLTKEPLAGFEFEHFELKGDALVQKGQKEQARQAYQTALSNSTLAGEYVSVVRMKLDNLG